MRQVHRGRCAACCAALLLSCGPDSETRFTRDVRVTVVPANAELAAGATQQLTASVTGTNDTRVTWTVVEGSSGGAVTADGLYTAPTSSGTYHVGAVSTANPDRSAMATIVVVSRQRPRLTVSPAEATVAPGTSLTFIAQLTGLSTGLVTWAVSEGTAVIDASGMFLAPFAGGVYHVIASSLEDPSLTATATVTVPQLVVSVTPSSATVPVGNTIQLAVSPQLGATPVVSWAVAEGAIGGGVSPSGLYTAPVTPGAYHVVATSLALPAINGEAVIQVVDPGPNLFDRGGPVLPTAHVYLIWWGDQGALAAPRAELESFLSVLDGSSYLGLGDEYLHGGTAHVSLRGEFSDPSTPAEAFNGSIAPEACAVITAAGQRVDPLGIYFVFTSFPLTAAGAAGWHGGDTCAGASYRLAWVEAFEGVIDPCEGRDGIGAAVVAFFSHELLETMTDPDGNAWKDVDGEEVADKCPQTCHTIGSHSWYTNALWSNTTGSCR